MVKWNIMNSEMYIVLHYPTFIFADFPSAGTATCHQKGRVGSTLLSIQRIINAVMPKPFAVES